ncbi:MAG: sugar phosphate nucleotidyltransferase [Endozoicomonadaceae bacterium]|nr:sugar phosphate nucleotidyltransferase [Endozoicomonadaceae bacterium]
MLIPVILSGGSGSRLWPQSRAQFPKQFINFNAKYTLFQETLHRLKGIPELAPPLVISNYLFRAKLAGIPGRTFGILGAQ